jgi:environmental stress-induced protein Ves
VDFAGRISLDRTAGMTGWSMLDGILRTTLLLKRPRIKA